MVLLGPSPALVESVQSCENMEDAAAFLSQEKLLVAGFPLEQCHVLGSTGEVVGADSKAWQEDLFGSLCARSQFWLFVIHNQSANPPPRFKSFLW